MLYRQYGKTNEQVSILGFGCMRLPVIGQDPTKIDEDKAIAMIRRAIDAGVNYVDTAYPYHGTGMGQPGFSEPLVGKALQDGYRDKVKLATKLPSWLIKTRSDMDRLLEEQLRRLQTDRIDFYLVHTLDKNLWPAVKTAGVTDFLDQALRDGRIRHAGFSFHDQLPVFKEIVDGYDWSFCQIQYNYLDENFQAGTEGLHYAAARGLGIAVMEPLRGGKIAQVPPEAQAAFDRADVQRTPAAWGYRWVWNHPEVSVVLSGMSTMEQVEENLRTAEEGTPNSLTAAELAVIDEVKDVFRSRIKVPCTACEYCMPCPSGVNIPKNFSCYNDYFLFGRSDSFQWVPAERRASRCVECGLCEQHCPQGIAIREELKQVKALLE